MRLPGIRLPLLAAAAWAGIGLTVYATDLRYGETIYVSPTSTTVSLAPTYLASTSYVPTDFIVPSYIPTSAAYVSTSYYADPVTVLPTTYLATTYRRGLFGRRWLVERPLIASYGVAYVPSSYVASSYVASSYVPSSYFVPSYSRTSYRVNTYRPTVWQYPGVWETAYTAPATICCDEVAWAAPAQSFGRAPITSSPAPSGARRTNDAAAGEDPTIPSNVDPVLDEAAIPRAPLPENARDKVQSSATGSSAADAPTPPVVRPDRGAAQSDATKAAQTAVPNDATKNAAGKSGPAPNPVTPLAPGGGQNDPDLRQAPQGGGDETLRRDSQRPANYTPRSRLLNRRNVLIGTVETESGERREEVHVTVVNRDDSFLHHDGISNAFGGFAIHVPDGRWTVKVTMPSGRVETVRDVTVTNGIIMDNREAREVYNLIITF